MGKGLPTLSTAVPTPSAYEVRERCHGPRWKTEGATEVGFEQILNEIVQQTGPYALAVLFGAALIEYVFPPFPGDTVVLFGAYYAVQGVQPLALVFLAVTAGSVVGAAIDYSIGRRIGAAMERRMPREPRRFHWASLDQVHRIEAAYRRHGSAYILINRFLPGVRGFFFVGAGMAGMPMRKVIGLGAVSAAVWNGVLLGAGWAAGENLDKLERLFRTYSVVAWGAMLVVGLGFLARWWSGRRKKGALGADEGR